MKEFLQDSTPEQRIVWEKVQALIGWHTITRLFYMGVSAGSEFLTYDANKLYIAFDISSAMYTLTTAANVIELYNEANALSYKASNISVGWDGVAVKYSNNEVLIRNVYFSRLTAGSYIRFNGYKLTV
jgi:hypothetical protein